MNSSILWLVWTCRTVSSPADCIIDIANILISSLDWRNPDDNAAAMIILREEGVVPLDFDLTLRAMVRFRNILVHIYLDIDRNRIYDVL